ncbi:MAG: hypothetical protein MHPSP_000239, partial [Paramarteilia canceri]
DIDLIKDILTGSKKDVKKGLSKILEYNNSNVDVSSLYSNILKVNQIDDLKIKKASYYILTEYSSKVPDLVILCMNTLSKDFTDPNPTIRCMVTKAVGRLNCKEYGSYFCESILLKALSDSDPFVRKSAVISIIKIYNQDPEILTKYSLLGPFIKCLSDNNIFVISNTLFSLQEIIDNSAEGFFDYFFAFISKLFEISKESSPWNKAGILQFICYYPTNNVEEADFLIFKSSDYLTSNHAHIVYLAAKIIFTNLEKFGTLISDHDHYINVSIQSLLTLIYIGGPHAYTVLKSIQSLLGKFKENFSPFVASFFIKSDDKRYVKIEKLKILEILINETNYEIVLDEIEDLIYSQDPIILTKVLECLNITCTKIPKILECCLGYVVDIFKISQSEHIHAFCLKILSNYNSLKISKKAYNLAQEMKISYLENSETMINFLDVLASSNLTILNLNEILLFSFENFVNKTDDYKFRMMTFLALKYFENDHNDSNNLYFRYIKKVLTIVIKDESYQLRECAIILMRILKNKNGKNDFKTSDRINSQVSNNDWTLGIKNLLKLSSLYNQSPDTFQILEEKKAICKIKRNKK